MNPRPESLLDALLKPGATGSEQEWRQVKETLAASFATYLGEEVEPVWEPLYEDISPGWGFAFGIRSRRALGGPLALEWYGVVSHNGSHTCAIVLLFAQDQRAIHHEGREYLYFEFAPGDDGSRRWVSRGWASSEMYEWEGYTRLTKVCEDMRGAQAQRNHS